MNTTSIMRSLGVGIIFCCAFSAFAQDTKQKTFATPDDAVVAVVDAVKAGNRPEMLAILGDGAETVLSSGDPVMDQRSREVFLIAYSERAALKTVDATHRVLYIGSEDWPLPIPLVKEGQVWRFDTAAGLKEVLYRRIGRNEMSTIRGCQTFAEAQKEYAATGHDGKPAGLYAQLFASSPRKQDGLYWKSDDPDNLSPLGEFVAEAATQGYHGSGEGQATPFRGYLFRMLTSQGKSANRGARDYITNGEMTGGFAMIAFPAAYGVSGVMTFIVNQDGVVYQKDLGPDTLKVAAGITQFDPGSGWVKAN